MVTLRDALRLDGEAISVQQGHSFMSGGVEQTFCDWAVKRLTGEGAVAELDRKPCPCPPRHFAYKALNNKALYVN